MRGITQKNTPCPPQSTERREYFQGWYMSDAHWNCLTRACSLTFWRRAQCMQRTRAPEVRLDSAWSHAATSSVTRSVTHLRDWSRWAGARCRGWARARTSPCPTSGRAQPAHNGSLVARGNKLHLTLKTYDICIRLHYSYVVRVNIT